jgi:hypothetical protein
MENSPARLTFQPPAVFYPSSSHKRRPTYLQNQHARLLCNLMDSEISDGTGNRSVPLGKSAAITAAGRGGEKACVQRHEDNNYTHNHNKGDGEDERCHYVFVFVHMYSNPHPSRRQQGVLTLARSLASRLQKKAKTDRSFHHTTCSTLLAENPRPGNLLLSKRLLQTTLILLNAIARAAHTGSSLTCLPLLLIG